MPNASVWHKGHLQYYFPTRSDLLHAAFAKQTERHRANWLAAAQRPADTPEQALRRLIAFELEANSDASFITKVMERRALVRHDPMQRQLGNSWLRWVTAQYAGHIAELCPGPSPATCRHRAIALYALLVGATPYSGEDPAVPDAAPGLHDALIETAMSLVTTS